MRVCWDLGESKLFSSLCEITCSHWSFFDVFRNICKNFSALVSSEKNFREYYDFYVQKSFSCFQLNFNFWASEVLIPQQCHSYLILHSSEVIITYFFTSSSLKFLFSGSIFQKLLNSITCQIS